MKFCLYSFYHCEYSFLVIISTMSNILTSDLQVQILSRMFDSFFNFSVDNKFYHVHF